MTTIRSNVFETNSSSVHSLVLSNENVIRLKQPIEINTLAADKYYGWDFRKYTTKEDKLNYLLALVCANYQYKKYNRLWKYRRKHSLPTYINSDLDQSPLQITDAEKKKMLPIIKEFNKTIDRIVDVLKAKGVKVNLGNIRKITQSDMNAKHVEYSDYCNVKTNADIDHGTCARVFYENVMKNDKNIVNWVLGKSFFVTGSDNCTEKESAWADKQTRVKFPHKKYFKFN